MIVVAPSNFNQCQYCVVAHGAILRIRAKDPLTRSISISAFFGMSNRLANMTSMRPNSEFYTMGRS
jgi:4-carboxymuconolactone decarboxylase